MHRSDAARLVALGLEKAPAGAILLDSAQDHFGWIGGFFAMDAGATSLVTQELLGWTPVGPTLIEDIDAGAYSVPTRATA